NRVARRRHRRSEHMPSIDSIVATVSEGLEIKNAARDRALVDSRQIVRHAATSIRALHRLEFDRAAQSLREGSAMVKATREQLADHPDLYWTGYVQDAQKEIAEAHLVAAMVQGHDLPGPAD